MALLQIFSSPPLSMSVTATPMFMLQRKAINLKSKSSYNNVLRVCTHLERGALVVRAASLDIDGSDAGTTEPETVPVEKLPLESKKQLLFEAKLRMKLAKKIRLRRKRLVRKRKLRKIGRWPPSKMKKNKNV
ncbi:hypothetical protein IFM89_025648 [Coptis chinensis]|uniref:50S ribosomal protein 5, chloroplastic n=1 Tax=Coptis chinensis TaxID=261450 RepID=A0A835LIM1_9MAGN|nr:hypothetical protein IFM89_025648 [Coptis chinensis]